MKQLSTKTELLYDAGSGEIVSIKCSHDLTYWFAVVKTPARKFVVVADGVPGHEYDHMSRLTILPDGSRVFYRARRKGRDYLVIGGLETQEHEVPGDAFRIKGCDPVSTREERCWIPGWLMRRMDIGNELLYDETRTIRCEHGEGPWFSPDLSRFACVVLRGSRMLMMSNGEPSPEYDFLGRPIFSEDGKHMAYCAVRDGDAFVVLDGKEIQSPGPVAELRISPDGKHVAWVSTVPFPDPDWTPEDEFVILDSLVGPSFESIEDLAFSPDSRELLYISREKNKLFRVSVEVKEEKA